MMHPIMGVLGLSGGELVLVLTVLLGWGLFIIGGAVAIVYFVTRGKQSPPPAQPPLHNR